MKYLLDTNAIIHLIHSHKILSPKIQEFTNTNFAISGYTEAELRYAVENSPEIHRMQNEIAISLALAPFQRIYHDENVSFAYGKIKAQLKQQKIYELKNEIDIFIAATAVAHNLILITNNLKDFEKIQNLVCEDWTI